MAGAIAESPAIGIGKLLNESRFIVPSHQRDYSWTEDEVAQLFDDVEAAIEAEHGDYFLGMVVFQSGETEELIVLDGQQRLATVVIIFSAIRNWLRQYGDRLADAQTIQHEHIGRRDLGAKEVQARLTLNSANNQQFTDCVIGSIAIADVIARKNALKRQDRSRRLLEAIIYAHNRVTKMAEEVAGADAAAERFFKFVKYVRDNVRVIRLVVTNDAVAYTIFETLNDRGIDLSPLDLVKNHVFKKADQQSAATLRDMEARWTQMMATLANVRSAGAFLKAFWTSRHGRVRTRNLFDELRKTYKDAETAIELSIDMLAAAEFYAALEVSDDPVWSGHTPQTRQSVQDLKVLGWQLFYPVAIAALAKFGADEMERLLRAVVVVIVRYQIIQGGNTGKLETTVAILARKIFIEEVKTATQAFHELKDYYPTDADFKLFFSTKQENSNQKAQYLLRGLERQAQIKLKGKMAQETMPGSITVEHVLPRNPGPGWKAEIDADPTLVEECAHRLGNMCILTKVNRELGSKPFGEKKPTYAASDLATTKEIAEYNSWNRATIERRQDSMAELAVQAWRFQ